MTTLDKQLACEFSHKQFKPDHTRGSLKEGIALAIQTPLLKGVKDKSFTPDLSPHDMFEAGIFCNGYFRPIYSSLLGKVIKNDYKKYKLGVSKEKLIIPEEKWDPSNNKYGVKASLPLIEWERKGWIVPEYDPRGWVEWYLNYSSGRRVPDYDDWQIKRWLDVKRRFGAIRNKTPAIKQTLLQWAIGC